jgi:hypothetical protein
MKPVYALIVAAMMLVPIPVMADVATMGFGNVTCSKLGNDLSNPTMDGSTIELIMMTWVQGYISGMNVQTLRLRKEYRDMAAFSTDEPKRMVLAYCNTHPFAEIAEAAVNLYTSLPLKQFTPPNAASHR